MIRGSHQNKLHKRILVVSKKRQKSVDPKSLLLVRTPSEVVFISLENTKADKLLITVMISPTPQPLNPSPASIWFSQKTFQRQQTV